MMNKEYTYHIFYINPKYKDDLEWIEFINDILDNEDIDLGIYAYTDNNEIAKMFQSTRNMKRFIHTKQKLSRQEVHDLAEYHPRGYLEKKKLSTILKKGKGEIELVLTKRESAYCFNEMEWKRSTMLYKTFLPPLKIFREDIINDLIKLGYLDILRFQDGKDMKHNFLEDSLSVFMNRFYLTMKGS